jgi:hypothetical protein
MAAGLGFKTFNTGDVLSAADTNGYLMQGVLVFADATARTAAITSPEEGQVSFLKDTNSTEYYDGSAWVAIGGGSSPLTTKGDLYTYSTTDARLAVGANGTTLVADSAEATGLKWATPAGGKVLQVVQGITSTSTIVASTSMTDTTLTANITPTSATSKILVLVSQNYTVERSAAAQGHRLQILRDATNIFLTGGSESAGGINLDAGNTLVVLYGLASFNYLDSPATTSALTYKTQGRVDLTTNSGKVTYQAGSANSTITLLEIGA